MHFKTQFRKMLHIVPFDRECLLHVPCTDLDDKIFFLIYLLTGIYFNDNNFFLGGRGGVKLPPLKPSG